MWFSTFFMYAVMGKDIKHYLRQSDMMIGGYLTQIAILQGK